MSLSESTEFSSKPVNTMSESPSPKGHILLVDDTTSLLNALTEFLTDQGYAVDAVALPQEALSLSEEKIYDLVVTDYRMPGLSGLDLMSRLKESNPEVEVIMITGYGSKESVLEALQLGAYDYIEKPFDTIELLKSIVNCLDTIRLRTRIDHLVQDLRSQQLQLERAVDHQGQKMDDVASRLQDLAAYIQQSNQRLLKDVVPCRKRSGSYLTDIARLVTTTGRETRALSTRVTELEDLADEITDVHRDVPPDPPRPKAAANAAISPRQEEPEGQQEQTPAAEADPIDPAAERIIDGFYAGMQRFVGDLMAGVESSTPVRIGDAEDLMEQVVKTDNAIEQLYRRAIYSSFENEDGETISAVVSHSVHVAIYALKLGEGLGYERERLVSLGIAGLLHDVGMAFLPSELYAKDRFEEDDLAKLREHPAKGHQYLQAFGESWSWIAQVVLQEHEREDGSGYPSGLRGKQIMEEARIIGIVDTYAGITRARPGRRRLLPLEAVKEITQTYRDKFSRPILRALLHELSAFPIGSIVRLNSGTVVQVVRTDAAHPLRPVVKPVYDAEGTPIVDGEPIPLRGNPILHISGAVYQNEISPG